MLWVLARVGPRGATYEGLRQALGHRESRATRAAVRAAAGAALVVVNQTGRGPRCKATIRLTPLAWVALSHAGLAPEIRR